MLAEAPDGRERVLEARRTSAALDMAALTALEDPLPLLLIGHRDEARKAWHRLQAAPTKAPWFLGGVYGEGYRQVLAYACGNISAEELLRAVRSSRQNVGYAHVWIGMMLLADGDRAGAREHFQKAVDGGAQAWKIRNWCLAFLARMDQDPTWPKWIPLRQSAATQPAAGPR